MSGSESGDEEYDGSLFPVFVTAEMPLDTINEVFKRSADYTVREELEMMEALVLVRDSEDYNPTEPTAVPVGEDFTSPFIGKSNEEIIAVFENGIAPAEDEEETCKAGSVFVVLDERTARDKTVLLVSLSYDGTDYARTDPEIACMMAMGPEMGTSDLCEGAELDTEPDGTVYYTEQRYRAMMDEEIDMDDSAVEDDEDDENA